MLMIYCILMGDHRLVDVGFVNTRFSAPTSLSPAATLRLRLLNVPSDKAFGRPRIPAHPMPMARDHLPRPWGQHPEPLPLPPPVRPQPRRQAGQPESVKLVESSCLVCLRLGLCGCSRVRSAFGGATAGTALRN